MASLTEMVEAALEGEGNVNFRSFGRDGFDKHRPFIWRLLLNVVVGMKTF